MSGYSSNKTVVIHQTAPSISSAYTASSGYYASSNESRTPRSMSPGDEADIRVFGADGHKATVKNNKGVTIVNRHQTGYDSYAPSPSYGGGYARR
ncbi:hypothetical protein EsH8_VII_000316 [Colletotrichum jinshuiense]